MTTATDPKEIRYCDGDYRASYEGNCIGFYSSYLAAEIALDEYAPDLARQTTIDTANLEADRAADDYAECASCGDLYTCNSESSRSPYICPACKENGELPNGWMRMSEGNILDTDGMRVHLDPPEGPDSDPLPPWPDLFDQYRAAYGWARVELEDRQVVEIAA